MFVLRDYYLGILYAVIAAVLWSINPALIKRFGKGVSPIGLNFLRSLMAIPFLAIAVQVFGFYIVPKPMGFVYILGSALIGPGIGDIAYIRSIHLVGAGRSITIGYTYVVIAQFLAIVFLGESITYRLVIGTIAAVAGVYIVFSEYSDGDSSRYSWIALVPAFAWGLGSVVNKLALEYTNSVSLGLMRAIILPIFLGFLVRDRIEVLARKEVLLLALTTGGLGYGVGIPLFLKAIELSGVTVAVLATVLTPVLGRILSSFIANEKTGLKGYLGTLLVVLGIVIGTL